MKFKTAVVACSALIVATPNALAQPLPIEDLARYESVSGVSMSIEGDLLFGLVLDPTRDGTERAAAVWDIGGKIDTSKPLQPRAITPHNGRMRFVSSRGLKQGKSLWIGQQAWTGRLSGCGEGRLTGSTATFVVKAYLGDRDLKIEDMPEGSKERMSEEMRACLNINNTTTLASALRSDPESVVINRFSLRDGERYFKHNLRTGKEEYLYADAGRVRIAGISGWDGMPYSKTETDVINGEWQFMWHLIDKRTGAFTREDPLTARAKDRFAVSVLGRVTETGKYYVLTDKFSDKQAVYMYDPSTDAFDTEPLVAHPEFNVAGLIFSTRAKDYGAILGFAYDAADREVFWVDPEFESIQASLDAAYPGRGVSIQSYNDDLSRILFTVEDSTMPAAYFLLVDKSKVAVIGAQRPWIKPDTLRKTELVYYTARDGLKIPGLLTLPKALKPGEKARGAIILPHGGPWARDYADWFGAEWPQFFASRGFAVLQPQYRGSDGWGRQLWLAGDREWGLKMQDDKDDGAEWLISQGYVDPGKLAIFGYSYGGFAAMAATVRPGGPFKCAIAGAGVSDLARLGNNWSDNRLQRAFQGDTVKGMDPIKNTDKASIPILVFHGDRDVRVPLFHGVDFYNAVKKHQPQSELLILKDAPHGFPWPEHTRTMYEGIEKFLTGTCGL